MPLFQINFVGYNDSQILDDDTIKIAVSLTRIVKAESLSIVEMCLKKYKIDNLVENVFAVKDESIVADIDWPLNNTGTISNSIRWKNELLNDIANMAQLIKLQKLHSLKTSVQAEKSGFATYNKSGLHLCVDIPDNWFTITCRTSNGQKITFAFCPYAENSPPRCVDILHHTSGNSTMNGEYSCVTQSVTAYTPGHPIFHRTSSQLDPCTCLVVSLMNELSDKK